MTPDADEIARQMIAAYTPEMVGDIARAVLRRIEADGRPDVPHDRDVEMAVLGALLLSAKCCEAAVEAGWHPDVHYIPALRRIATAYNDHLIEHQLIDMRTPNRVLARLHDQNLLLDGDVGLVADAMVCSVPSPPGVAHDAARLVDLHQKRLELYRVEAHLQQLTGSRAA